MNPLTKLSISVLLTGLINIALAQTFPKDVSSKHHQNQISSTSFSPKMTNKTIQNEGLFLQSSLEAEFYFQNGLYERAFNEFLALYEQFPTQALAEKVFITGFFSANYHALEKVVDGLDFTDEAREQYQNVLIALYTFIGKIDRAEALFNASIDESQQSVDQTMDTLIPVLDIEWHNRHVLAFVKDIYDRYPDENIRRYYASLAMLHGQVDKVKSLSDTILAANPKDIEWLQQYSSFLNTYVNEEQGQRIWNEALADFPKSIRIRIRTARSYLQSGNEQAAIDTAKLLPDDDSGFGIKRILLASAYLRSDNLAAFETLLEDAEHAGVLKKTQDYVFIAEVLRENQHYKRAVTLLENRPKGAEDHASLIAKLALLKTHLKDYDAARELIEEAVDLDTEQSLHADLIEASYREEAKQYDSALSLIDNYLASYPEDRSVLYQRTLVLDQLGRYKTSIEGLRDLFLSQPLDNNSQNALGYMLITYTDHIEEGMKLVKKAFRSNPRSAPITDSIGWGHFRLKNLERAEFFLRAAYFQIQDPEVLAHLIVVLLERGKIDEATKRLNQHLDTLSENKRIEKIWLPYAKKHELKFDI